MTDRMEQIRAAKTLEDLYVLVPKPIDCTGQCWDSCGPISYSVEEGERMNAVGQRPPNGHEQRQRLMCPALTPEHLCSVYDARPLICRLWGVSESMPCPHNPCWTAFPLSKEETQAMLAKSYEIGGSPPPRRTNYKIKPGDLLDIIRRDPESWTL